MAEKKNSTGMRRNLRREGARYERIAGAFLVSRGYHILCYNFRCRQSEIDIVARDGRTLVFVEVKYRAGAGSGSPFEAVNARKQYRICRCADYYRARYQIPQDRPCRFDVIGFQAGRLRHIQNAFAYIAP